MKKITSLLLLIAMALSLLVSCNGNGGNSQDDDTDTPEEIVGIDISNYVIVRSDDASKDLCEYIKLFKSELKRYIGVNLAVATDYDNPGDGKKEILIGETEREESITARSALSKAPNNAFTVRATEDKIVIAAQNDDALIRAMKFFLMTYAAPSQKDNFVTLEIGKAHNGTVDLNSIIFPNYTEFSVQYSSTIAVSKRDFDGICAYETLIKLGHNGKDNGTLFASFAAYSEKGYRIYKSTDNGKSWEHISTAVDTYNSKVTGPKNPTKHLATNCCLQPCLFELPKDMGDFKEGTLFLGACTKGEGYYNEIYTQTTSMTLYYSTDLGASWTPYCNVDLAGNDPEDNGVWEPYFVFEEETGRVYCFYSDESNEANDKHGDAAQKLVYKYSTDMKTWIGQDGKTGVTDEPFIVANCKFDNYRPGMISIAEMGNGEYFMTYELCGVSGCPIYYRTTTDLANWPNPESIGTLIKSDKGTTLGSAPWCAWSPAGGECGTLVVIGSHTDLFLSFDYGKTFTVISNPMYNGQKSDDKTSYSPFLGFSEDGQTLYYLDNPSSANGSYQSVLFQNIRIW